MVVLMLKVFAALVCAVVAVELGARIAHAWQRVGRRRVHARLEMQSSSEQKTD